MGNSSYSVDARLERATTMKYATAPVTKIFTQSESRQIHAAMNPSGVAFRESRDSELHPHSIPVQLYLDVTGSMGHIPHELIKEGLPKLMGGLIQKGLNDISLMFGAIGDHECDRFPLQIGQFESGDAELDMWLTRTFLEGGGGGNAGESYLLAWYFASNHIQTDAFSKRRAKGFVFTVGDEPNLTTLPMSAVKGLMGTAAAGQGTSFTAAELLTKAQETNHVFHIHVDHGGRHVDPRWKELLGENCIVITDHTTLPMVLSDIILKTLRVSPASVTSDAPVQDAGTAPTPKVDML